MTDDIQDLAERAPETTEKLAEFSEKYLTKLKVQYGLLGVVAGAAAGGLVAWKISYLKAKKDANQRADDEIAEMREHYLAKGRAMEAQAGKGDLDQIVKDRGYVSPEPDTSASPPMAVQPPKSVVDSDDDEKPPDDSEMGENSVEGPNGVKARGEEAVRNIFQQREQVVPHEWDRDRELRRRSPDFPYVVHHDERHELEGYSDVSYTYYAADDVLCDERDEVIDPARRDELVGEANLDRFGHGSGDPMIVFIRNDNLEILYEIIKSPNSFAEEVHGFTHNSWDRGNLEKMRRKERDEEG